MTHQKRQASSIKLSIPRKGTKYVVVPSSHKDNSVPVLIALRDMLKLAKTAKEVQHMINEKLLKINGEAVKNFKESIKLFNVLHAGKPYILTLSPHKKFILIPSPNNSSRLAKITGKKILTGEKIQLNLHDGSNILSEEKVSINDTLELDFKGKIKSIIKPEKSRKVLVFKGKHTGQEGIIKEIKDKIAEIKFKDKEETTEIPLSNMIIQ